MKIKIVLTTLRTGNDGTKKNRVINYIIKLYFLQNIQELTYCLLFQRYIVI